MKFMQSLFASLFIFIFFTAPVLAGTEVRTYEIPDVREAFCGPEISPRHCKCAFHNQCGDGMDSDASFALVLSSFQEWNRGKIQAMGEQCLKRDGYWDKSDWQCTFCTEGDVLSGQKCVTPKQIDPEKAECAAALKNLPNSWEKYSDFDTRIAISDASYEVNEYNRVLDEIADMIAEVHALETEMEVMAAYRIELRAYKQALVQNIKTNLLKSFWRLSYVTYVTINSAKGAGGSVEKLLNPTDSAEAIGAGLKLIQANTPGHVKELQVSDGTIQGQVKSIGVNASLEALESIASPSAVVQQVMKDVKSAVVPSANISEAEVTILRTQHLENNSVDTALAESYAASIALRGQIWTLEASIANKYNELQQWKAKEYQRVRANLEEQCKQN